MSPNLDSQPDVKTAASRAFSRRLFGGAQYRLEIGAAIWLNPIVNTAELADDLGLSRQSVNQELRLLEQVGLLERQAGGERKVYLKRQESSYWSFCFEALGDALELMKRRREF